MTTVSQSRTVEFLVQGRATRDGAGVKLNRVLTHQWQQRLDPFLMLDVFASDNPDDYIAGFPSHPHRGFETVTYMLAGQMRHQDSHGHASVLQSGGMQWMTAGRGIIHSEMPEQLEGAMVGFQLWLNLPARNKMMPVWYRDFAAEQIPEFRPSAQTSVRVLAGDSHGVQGAMQRETTQPLYLVVKLAAGESFSQLLPASRNVFVYVHQGVVQIGEAEVPSQNMAILANAPHADGVTITASADALFLLLAGEPLHEPIAQYGPFVMNTEAELQQAVADYQSGQLTAPL